MADEEMFGPYRLDGLLGRGGMGEVFRAFDTVKKRAVAIKRLPARLTADPEFEARFRAESTLAARLHEPHIIPIHDFGEIDGRLYIDMRLVEGRDLAALLVQDGPLSPERATNVVAQVASALDVAHAQDLVHRDIKPSNVLVSSGGSGGEDFVYVADFGIARVISSGSTSLTSTGATIGSMEYMAPERFAGGHGDHRADIYSLGCLLFETLTGRKPFEVEGLPAIINAHLNTAPPTPSEHVHDLPKGLDGVVARAMAKEPDDRYPTAGALAVAARAAAAGADPEPGPPPTVSGSRPAAGAPPTAIVTPASDPGAPISPEAHLDPVTDPVRGSAGRGGGGLLVAAGVLAVLLLGGGALVFGMSERVDPAQIKTEPVLTAGDNPFMPPVGSDRPGVTPPSRSGGSFAGDTPGLYGGTRNESSCNRGQMIEFLRANPDKQDAWGRVQGVSAPEVPDYIAGLTPVLLRSDTAVTNHGWKGGEANPLQSVLQAGTAVLVDGYGVPRARCSCGNPLTPPAGVVNPRYSGQTWSGFETAAVTTIQPAPSTVSRFTMVDPVSNETFLRGRGTAGEVDQPQAPPPPPVETTPVTPPVQPPPPPPVQPPPPPVQPPATTEPTPPPATVRVATVTVRGNQQWIDTGIGISEGDRVSISATGRINVFSGRSDFNKSPAGGPDCTSSNSQNSGQWTANGFPCWSLLGRVSGKAFYIGSGKSFDAQTSGTLKLGVNDESSASFNDNSGSWQVSVRVTSGG